VGISRRQLLWLLPTAAALATCPPAGARTPLNVRDFGAVGNGIADDSAAIRAACAALKPGGTLFFPKGSYRFAEQYPRSSAAIRIAGLSNVAVEFAPGAELVMDNVDPGSNVGTSHGILITGPASRITLRNVAIRWVTAATRSLGDGIRIVGYPGDADPPPGSWKGSGGTIGGVELINCKVDGAPQTGVIMIGVSDITVTGLLVTGTQADGLHFHACRGGRIDNYRAVDPGDDGLALVTYYTDAFAFDNVTQNFSFPHLTDWSNSDFVITNVWISGGRANGVRLAGANRVSITGLNISGVQTGAAVIVDSSALGVDTGWHYVASRGILLRAVQINRCETGIHLLARPNASTDPRFTDFDIGLTDATIRGCTNWSIRMESLTSQRATGLSVEAATVEADSGIGGKGAVGLDNAHGVQFGTISIRHAQAVVALYVNNTHDLSIDAVRLTVTDTVEPRDASTPGVNIQNSKGAIGAIDVNRAKSPPNWTPVRVARAAVPIGTLTVSPPSIRRWITHD